MSDFPTDETKESAFKHSSTKSELELYKDEDNKIGKVLRVKREVVKGLETWKLMEDKSVLFSFTSDDVSALNLNFLRSPEGFLFVLAQCKRSRDLSELLQAINDRIVEA